MRSSIAKVSFGTRARSPESWATVARLQGHFGWIAASRVGRVASRATPLAVGHAEGAASLSAAVVLSADMAAHPTPTAINQAPMNDFTANDFASRAFQE